MVVQHKLFQRLLRLSLKALIFVSCFLLIVACGSKSQTPRGDQPTLDPSGSFPTGGGPFPTFQVPTVPTGSPQSQTPSLPLPGSTSTGQPTSTQQACLAGQGGSLNPLCFNTGQTYPQSALFGAGLGNLEGMRQILTHVLSQAPRQGASQTEIDRAFGQAKLWLLEYFRRLLGSNSSAAPWSQGVSQGFSNRDYDFYQLGSGMGSQGFQ